MRRPFFTLGRDWQRGFTLLEITIAAGLIGVIAYESMRWISSFSDTIVQVDQVTGQDMELNAMMMSLRTNIGLLPISFDSSATARDNALIETKLPFAWSKETGIVPVADCTTCSGRLGYVVQPVGTMRGIYLVSVRVVNPKLFEGYRDYSFVTGGVE